MWQLSHLGTFSTWSLSIVSEYLWQRFILQIIISMFIIIMPQITPPDHWLLQKNYFYYHNNNENESKQKQIHVYIFTTATLLVPVSYSWESSYAVLFHNARCPRSNHSNRLLFFCYLYGRDVGIMRGTDTYACTLVLSSFVPSNIWLVHIFTCDSFEVRSSYLIAF